jgi:squalene cyclase
MLRRRFLGLACTSSAAALLLLRGTSAWASKEKDPKKEEKYKQAVAKGLEWLVKTQNKDGHWEAFNGQYPITMTAMGGMAMLMEGSTIREGKYKDNIRRACDWLMARSNPNGLIGSPNIPGESGRYTYGHGYSMMFLACIYGEEDEGPRRTKLEDILIRAAKFSRDAQTNRGGWGYVSARERNFDEGSTTVTQVQGLRAVRNAGIPVPPEAIKDAVKYLKDATNAEGGIMYSLGGGGGTDGRPALTAAGIACGFSTGDYNSDLVKRWFKFVTPILKQTIGMQRMGHDEYTYYYLSQAVYMLGEDGWAKLFPGTPEADQIKWSSYRERTFDSLVSSQQADGSWPGQYAGPVFSTSIYLSIMQLDNAVLPLYQR